jgi:hypothetical protein
MAVPRYGPALLSFNRVRSIGEFNDLNGAQRLNGRNGWNNFYVQTFCSGLR